MRKASHKCPSINIPDAHRQIDHDETSDTATSPISCTLCFYIIIIVGEIENTDILAYNSVMYTNQMVFGLHGRLLPPAFTTNTQVPGPRKTLV